MRVTYDPEAGAAYVYLGPARFSARTAELDSDCSVMVDYDEHGEVIGIEILGVSQPELEVYAPRRSRARKVERTEVKGELL